MGVNDTTYKSIKTLRYGYFASLLGIVGMWMVSGCSTTNHAPLPAMVYHDLTSHYNAYFNTKEKLKAVIAGVEKSHKDDYKEVLPIFAYSNPKECGTYSADLEDIEKRCTESVQLHKVSNYADDHFLLMGRARYLKGDYDKAQAFFKYITTEYKNGVDYVKERKKENKPAHPTLKKKPAKKPRFKQVLDAKGNLVLVQIDDRPSYNHWIHEPARAEALVWLARTYSANKQYPEAAAVIQFARSDPKFYKNLDVQVEAAEAENLLRQKNFHDAIVPLEKYLNMTKCKKDRVRPLFILAQINEQEHNYAKAADYYKAVLKSRPNYDMEFYAKIRRANLGRKSGGSSSEIRHLLAAMSHDGKYRDYYDQVYYELGEISLTENNRADARKYFKKSITASTKNMDQKALAFYRLASMDYEEEQYVPSKFNFDSTLTALNAEDTLYSFVMKRDKVLGNLVAQINTIYVEDSIQRIALMSPADRKRFLRKLVDQQEKETEEKEADAARGKVSAAADAARGSNPTVSLPGSSEDVSVWYFYNTNIRSTGYIDFTKKWGRRKLEENWRRKDKTSTESTADTDTTKTKLSAKDSADALPPGGKEEKLMASLPITPEAMSKSTDKVIEAYYLMGSIYKDDLQNYRKAIAAFEELIKRYSKNRFLLESYYQLYLLHEKMKNHAKAETYRSKILDEYPNSKIAKFLNDPKYMDEARTKDNSLYTYYASAFDDYSNAQYASAAKKCVDADAQFKDNLLKPKFDLLIAMIEAKENRLDEYVQSLNKVIKNYPSTPEHDKAQQLLLTLNKSKLPQIDRSKHPDTDTGFAMPSTALQHLDTATKAMAKADTAKAPVEHRAISLNNLPPRDSTGFIGKDKDKPAPADTAKPYKPLSRTERMDSLMRAERNAKNKPAATVIPTPIPTPSVKDSPVVAAYKPLSRTERMDSLMRAERIAKNKPTQTIIPTPTPTPDVTPATDTSKVKRKPLSRTERMDSIMRAEKMAKNKPQSITLPKSPSTPVSMIDTTHPSAPNHIKDSIAKAKLLKPVTKLSAKDSLVLKAKLKAASKDSLLKAAVFKVTKDSLIRVAALKAAKDSILKATTAKATKDSLLKVATLKAAKVDSLKKAASKAVVKELTTKPAPLKASKDTIKTTPPKVVETPKPMTKGRPTFDTDTTDKVYGLSDATPHSVVIYFLDPSLFNNNIAARVDSVNAIIHTADKLTARGVFIDNDHKLIVIKSFKNKEDAMIYVATLRSQIDGLLSTTDASSYFVGAISTLNYSELITTRKINNYRRFYRENYK